MKATVGRRGRPRAWELSFRSLDIGVTRSRRGRKAQRGREYVVIRTLTPLQFYHAILRLLWLLNLVDSDISMILRVLEVASAAMSTMYMRM